MFAGSDVLKNIVKNVSASVLGLLFTVLTLSIQPTPTDQWGSKDGVEEKKKRKKKKKMEGCNRDKFVGYSQSSYPEETEDVEVIK